MVIPLEECAGLPLARVGGKAKALAEALAQGFPVPPGVVVEPDATFDETAVTATLGPGPFAVRSSAPYEDAHDASWAGQFLTRLWVDSSDLGGAVRDVRESGRSSGALAYGSAGEPIPVLIQPIVSAEAAGVMFTIDPRDGRDDRCVIEAVAGLADMLAEGRARPARFVADALSGEVLESENADACPLGGDEVSELISLGLSVSEWRGVPLDVEWAWALGQPWLVQARPVTAAAWAPAPGQWTAANFKEVMPGVVTPLTASMSLEHDFPRAVAEFTSAIGLARPGEDVTEGRLFYGHAYWRVDRLKELLLALPGFRERSFDETIGIAPAYEGDGRRSRTTLATLARALPALLSLRRAYRREVTGAGRYRDAFALEEAQWLAVDWDGIGDDELSELVREAVEQHWRTNRWAMRVSFLSEQAQDDLRLLLRGIESRVDPPPSEGLLLSSLDDVATGAAARALVELADSERGVRDRVLAAREQDELPPSVRARFGELVERFGYMAEADEELSQPRWDEDASIPLALLKTALAGGGERSPERDPGAEEERLARAARLRARAVRRKAATARLYAWWREELRDVLARTNRLTRRAFLAQGRRWAERGVLADETDVFWLKAREVVGVLERTLEPAEAAARVGPRRRHAARFRNWRPPEALGAATAGGDNRTPPDEPSGVLRGTPCSAGSAEGPVAVLRSLSDAPSVEPGSVLVLEYSNPGWTPVYAIAAALVTEEGGLLSHGSIVARERGLPAVIQVPGATSIMRDGERVRVDGDRGTVTLLDRVETRGNASEGGAARAEITRHST
jgi:pyruvate,water dikinase